MMAPLTLAEIVDLTPPGPEIDGVKECRDPECSAWGEEPPYLKHYHPDAD